MATYTAHCGDWYRVDVRVWVDERLQFCPNGQCGVRYTDDGIQLISYDTLVCYTENGYLFCTGTYSKTTSKHINYFLKEYFAKLSYYDMKYCYEYNCCIDIATLEIVSNETGEVFTNWKDVRKDYKLRHKND